MKRFIIFLSILPIASCSTYMENKIGEEFKSIQPNYTNVMTENVSLEGAVYDGGGGLFASDRRANNVGDIITVTLEESMTAANSGTETTFGESPSRARRVLQKNDVIISTVRTYLRSIATITEDRDNLVGSTGFCVLRDQSGLLDQEYLSYVVKSEWFISLVIGNSYGVSYPAINSSELVDLKIVLPPLIEQKKITRALNEKIMIFDNQIRTETKKIDLLSEYRRSLISSAVTGKIRISEDMI